ncbi:hypothetical protein [Paraflavitalea pollutisoli]|uniref:hypothetical protein n=1 Tax=Paraflavitalea pollutisoli TaxID=3034143 RepID=UPI0023ECB752|nr:hypothetical protein [Paraflavitalea sp. H1-2-19X]
MTIVATIAMGVVVNWDSIVTTCCPRPEAAITINNFKGDNEDRQIAQRIRMQVAAHLSGYEAANIVKIIAANDSLNFDSKDSKSIKDHFLAGHFTKGLYACGSYRTIDSSLAGYIFLYQAGSADSLQHKIVIPAVDSIRVTVARKTELFGNLIIALVLREYKNYQLSNQLLEEILKDSVLLDYRFRHCCYHYQALNFRSLHEIEKATAADTMAAISFRAQNRSVEFNNDMYTYKAGDGYQLNARDSMYLYKNYLVILHKSPQVTYTLLQSGTRNFTRRAFISFEEIERTVDSCQ